MSLQADLARIVVSHGTARWRAERTGEAVMDLLSRRHLLPPCVDPPVDGVLTIKEFAALPASLRQTVTDHLWANRVGYWQWSAIRFGPEWQVCMYREAPDGGPCWGETGGELGPLMFWRTIPGWKR